MDKEGFKDTIIKQFKEKDSPIRDLLLAPHFIEPVGVTNYVTSRLLLAGEFQMSFNVCTLIQPGYRKSFEILFKDEEESSGAFWMMNSSVDLSRNRIFERLYNIESIEFEDTTAIFTIKSHRLGSMDYLVYRTGRKESPPLIYDFVTREFNISDIADVRIGWENARLIKDSYYVNFTLDDEDIKGLHAVLKMANLNQKDFMDVVDIFTQTDGGALPSPMTQVINALAEFSLFPIK